MTYRSVEIANEFLRQPDAAGHLTQMQLQKLVYLANGWNWALNGEQLVEDPSEAWDYGPVYRDLYDHTKYFGKNPLENPITSEDSEAARVFGFSDGKAFPYTAKLTDREKAIVSHVWKRYGRLSGLQLSALTHQRGTPWFNAYMGHGKNSVIEQNAIREHFEELAQRAQQAAA